MANSSESQSPHWNDQFLQLFDACCERYRAGNEDFNNYYDKDARAFLGTIGYKPREFFDFVEDFCDGYELSPSTALLVAAARRDYLMTVQKGQTSDKEILPAELPAKDSELDGLVWLPRILMKARGKLRGELNPEIMFSCGGDRAFLTRHNIHPADFLRVVWAAGDDESRVVEYVKTGRFS